ncbi:MAG: SelL-related redox protein, partial [Candidatus Rokuibacteriota bacterium]
MDDLLAAALGQMTVLDETGTAVSLGRFWIERPVVLAFVRHLGCIFCRQQVAGLSKRVPEIERRGGILVVVAPAKPEHIAGFRESTGYQGALFVDPALRAFKTAGLVHSRASTYHPLAVLKGIRAMAQGFRQVGRQGDVVQQGGTFVLGPGDRVRYEWRDRYAGDNPDLDEVVEALP